MGFTALFGCPVLPSRRKCAVKLSNMAARRFAAQSALRWAALLFVNFALIVILTCGNRNTAKSETLAAVGRDGVLGVGQSLEAGQGTCEKSLKDSHGFFCETDRKWELRKDIARRQQKNQEQPRRDRYFFQRGRMGTWFQDNYEPEFSCDLERRIGRPGDGGSCLVVLEQNPGENRQRFLFRQANQSTLFV